MGLKNTIHTVLGRIGLVPEDGHSSVEEGRERLDEERTQTQMVREYSEQKVAHAEKEILTLDGFTDAFGLGMEEKPGEPDDG